MELIALLKKREDKTLEYKRDMSSPQGIVKTVVAFANTAGGVLLIGVDDNKYVHGVSDPLKLEESLSNLLYDNVEPKLVPEIEVLPWRDKYVLKVEIYPSSSRPHYWKKHGEQEGVYIRVGSTNRRADETIIAELRRYQRLKAYDEETLSELGSESIDFDAVVTCFDTVRKIKKTDLARLGILAKYQSRFVPTIGGMILFGKERLDFFPDAQIRVGRFTGQDKSVIADSQTITAYPALAIEEAMAFIAKHAEARLNIEGVRHQRQWSVPMIALREAMINAVVHADYAQQGSELRLAIFDDRIEIDNPGLLLFGLTIDDLYEGVSKLRNRVIARVFHQLGLIEQWGSGVRRMLTECEKAGLPQPKFEELATHFRVTFYLHRVSEPGLDPVDTQIIATLEGAGDLGANTRDIAEMISLSPRATRSRLKALVAAGLVLEVASSEQDPQRRYYAV